MLCKPLRSDSKGAPSEWRKPVMALRKEGVEEETMGAIGEDTKSDI